MPQPTVTPNLPQTRPAPRWEDLEARLGSAYDVKGARAAGLTPFEVEDEGKLAVAGLHEKLGDFYDVQSAYDAGLSVPEILDEAKRTYQDINAEVAMERQQRLKPGLKLGPAPLAMTSQILGGAAKGGGKLLLEGPDILGGGVAEKISKRFPSIPAAVPATAGLATSLVSDPLNWLGPASVGKAGRLAEGMAAKQLAAGALEEAVPAVTRLARARAAVGRVFTPEAGKYYHQFDPRGVGETALGLAELGRGAGRFLKAGAEGLGRIVEEARTGGRALPDELQEALATVKERPQGWQDLGADTRINDLADALGTEKTISAEATLKAELEERRLKELMERPRVSAENKKRIEARLAEIEAAKADQGLKIQHPWEAAKKQADDMLKSEDAVVRAEGQTLKDAVDTSELGNRATATVDEVFSVGRRGPEPGLREESRTFRKFHGLDEQKNTLANSIKYFAGRFLADPSSVIPRMAYEAGRVFDRFNRTKFAFYDGVRNAFQGLNQTEKTVVSLMLDTHPKDWETLTAYGLRNAKTDTAYGTLRQLLDKLAEVEGLQKGQRIGDYFPHINVKAGKKGIVSVDQGQAAWASPAQAWLPRETPDTTGALTKMISEKSALGETFDPEHLLAIRINAGLRKAYFNPLVKTWETSGRLAGLSEGGKAYAEAYMNKLLGRPGKIFEAVEKALSKIPWRGGNLSMANLNNWQLGLTLNYYRGLLGVAVDTAFKNLGQIQNTIAELGYRNTAKGLGRIFVDTFITPEAKSIFRNAGVIDDYEHIVAGSMDMLNRGKVWKAMDKVLFAPMKFSEYLNRGTAFHAGLAEAYGKGLRGKKAVEFARAMVDKTQFRYGVTNTSPYLQNPFGKLWYQFSSYPMKEIEFINEILRDPDKRKLYRMLLFHGAVLGGGYATGSRLADAMGYEEVPLWFTGDPDTGEGAKSIPLPTGIFPHLGVFASPGMRLIATAWQSIGPPIRQLGGGELWREGPGPKTEDFINNIANTLPGRRYLGKVWDAYKKLNAGVDTKPPKVQEQIVSMMKGQGIKPYEPGGPGAEPYARADFLRELLGIQPRKKK